MDALPNLAEEKIFNQAIRSKAMISLKNVVGTSDKHRGKKMKNIPRHSLLKTPMEIVTATEIFNLTWKENTYQDVSIEDFVSFVNMKNQSFAKLIQYNLSRPYGPGNGPCGEENSSSEPDGFNPGSIDGMWGRNSTDALEDFLEFCGENFITGSMISGYLLPQLYTTEATEATEEAETTEATEEAEATEATEEAETTETTEEAEEAETTEATEEAETTEATEEAETSNQKIVKLTEKNSELERSNSELKSVNSEFDRLNKKYKADLNKVQSELDNQAKKPIFELLQGFVIPVFGEFPGKEDRIEATLELREGGCRLPLTKTLREAAIYVLKKRSCFDFSFRKGKEDTSQPRSYQKESNEIIVQLLPEQVKKIVSVRTDKIDGLTSVTIEDCGIAISFSKNGEIKKFIAGKSESGLFPSDKSDGQSAWLDDSDTIETQNISWNGQTVKLEATDLTGQKCILASPVEMEIVAGKYSPSKAPQALIDRFGNLTLHDLPITVVKGTTLVVFFDTNVGYRNQKQYAFNSSLESSKSADVQKVYFSGFVDGLKDYLSTEVKVDKIMIYEPINASTEAGTLEDFKLFFEATNIQKPDMKENIYKVLDEFKDRLTLGQEGNFSRKIKTLKRLKEEGGLIKAVSFGSSGLDASQACKPQRQLGNTDLIIFDVWPRGTLDELVDTETASETPGTDDMLFKCNKFDSILGFRISTTNREVGLISGPVKKYLVNLMEQ